MKKLKLIKKDLSALNGHQMGMLLGGSIIGHTEDVTYGECSDECTNNNICQTEQGICYTQESFCAPSADICHGDTQGYACNGGTTGTGGDTATIDCTGNQCITR